ncbi:cytochrome P450 89A2-like [Tripterygium wilfordii]|uniref:cytochrome P450 89A2-like n=1 Tax=Tripterygium wilfordii TaxID=458696 RepID=UPI0018F86459|nr:cytochrome P450 89A2-like [Tripterygium wilfordii]
MELWFSLVAFLLLCSSLHALIKLFRTTKKLPPGPPTIPVIGNFLWLLKTSKSFSNVEPVLRQLRAKYGPIVTLYLGSQPSIFITNRDTAHRALVQGGSAFASRPLAVQATQVIFSNHRTIAMIPYGNQWRILRQNLMSSIHPTRLNSYSPCRRWALEVLKNRLAREAKLGRPVRVVDHIQHAMFCLLIYMLFGEKFEEKTIREISEATKAALSNFTRFNVLNFMPIGIGKIVFRKLWKELLQIRHNQLEVFLPLIRARREKRKNEEKMGNTHESFLGYLDTLLELKLPEGAKKEFSDEDLVSLCSEFLNGGTDTTTTALQWAMANLVKHQDIQEKLLSDINRVVKAGDEIKDDDLKRMPYLNAVVLETLRRHPPGHFIIPRAVVEDTKFDGYDIPRNAMVNFTVADMGWDPKVWEEPMEFKPERFLSDGENAHQVFDIKGVREIKMMPFGAGRRICPAISLAILHQQYFVANLIRDFKWTAENGCDVDLSEKQDFTIVMKSPLMAFISPRIN